MREKANNHDIFDVFAYDSFFALFRGYLDHRKAQKKPHSYRFLAKRLGIKSPSFINFLIAGKRLPSPALLQNLFDLMGIEGKEREYVEVMLELLKAETPRQRKSLEQRLIEMRGSSRMVRLDIATAQRINNWLIFTMFEMCGLPDMTWSAEWFHARLDQKATLSDIEKAMDTLLRFRFVEKVGKNNIERRSISFETPSGIPSRVLREYHREFLEIAREKILEQEPNERFYSSTTINIDKSDIAEANAMIEEFSRNFIGRFQAIPGEETYQLGMQFFRLTKSLTRSKQKGTLS